MVPFFSSTGKHNRTEHCASTIGLRTTSLQANPMVKRDLNSKQNKKEASTQENYNDVSNVNRNVWKQQHSKITTKRRRI